MVSKKMAAIYLTTMLCNFKLAVVMVITLNYVDKGFLLEILSSLCNVRRSLGIITARTSMYRSSFFLGSINCRFAISHSTTIISHT